MRTPSSVFGDMFQKRRGPTADTLEEWVGERLAEIRCKYTGARSSHETAMAINAEMEGVALAVQCITGVKPTYTVDISPTPPPRGGRHLTDAGGARMTDDEYLEKLADLKQRCALVWERDQLLQRE